MNGVIRKASTCLLLMAVVSGLQTIGCDEGTPESLETGGSGDGAGDGGGDGGGDTSSTAAITDGCSDGFGIAVRYFDQTSGGVWPGGSQAYVTDPGGTARNALACTPGNRICMGATTRDGPSRIWGVGIDGSNGCDSCCFVCGNGFSTRLTCS